MSTKNHQGRRLHRQHHLQKVISYRGWILQILWAAQNTQNRCTSQPIISSGGSATYETAKELAKILKPLVGRSPLSCPKQQGLPGHASCHMM